MATNAPTEMTKRERQKARRRQRAQEQRRAAQRRRLTRTLGTVTVITLAVVAVFGAALWLGRGPDATLGVAQPAVAPETQPLPPHDPSATPDPAVGQPAPAAVGADFDGNETRIGAGAGPQALAFMAHWCPHCQEEVPEVVAWLAEAPLPGGVELVAISTQHEPTRPNWPPDAWFAEEGWPGDVVVDSTDAVNQAYGLTGTPYWVFVDADGTVSSRASGRISERQFRDAVEEIGPR